MAQLSIETDGSEYFISNTEISIPEDLCTNENNDHGGTKSVVKSVQKSDIVSILLMIQFPPEMVENCWRYGRKLVTR